MGVIISKEQTDIASRELGEKKMKRNSLNTGETLVSIGRKDGVLEDVRER